MQTVDKVLKIENQFLKQDAGGILVINSCDLPFTVQRVFNVVVEKPCIRGNHAHIICEQILFAVSGEILVKVTDSFQELSYVLTPDGFGLYIPEMIWSNQQYLSSDSILQVYCSSSYMESEYIRDYSTYESQQQLLSSQRTS